MSELELPLSEEPLPKNGLQDVFSGLTQLIGKSNSYTGEISLNNKKIDKNASIFIENNVIVFAEMTGFEIPLAKRLYSGGFINKEQYDSIENSSLYSVIAESEKNFGVKKSIIEKICRESVLSILTFIYSWVPPETTWRWSPENKNSECSISGMPVESLDQILKGRKTQLTSIKENSPQVLNVGLYLDRGPQWDKVIAAQNPVEVIVLLNKANGKKKISEVANECGFTKFEMATLLSQLFGIGAVLFNKTSKQISAPTPDSTPLTDTPDSWSAPDVSASVPTELTPEEKMVAFSAAFAAGAGTTTESDWGEVGQHVVAGQRKYNKQLTKKLSVVVGSIVVLALVVGGVLYGPKLFGEDPRNAVATAFEENEVQDGSSSSGDNSSGSGSGEEFTIAGDDEGLPTQAGSIVEENAVEDDVDIVRVKQTIAIPFDKFSSTLSEEQENEILAFASRPLDRNETVVISGFAGLNAKEEGNAQRISEERAASIQSILSQNDINSSIIGYGKTPVNSILGEAMNAAIPEDVDHNRLAFVSAVVVKDNVVAE